MLTDDTRGFIRFSMRLQAKAFGIPAIVKAGTPEQHVEFALIGLRRMGPEGAAELIADIEANRAEAARVIAGCLGLIA